MVFGEIPEREACVSISKIPEGYNLDPLAHRDNLVANHLRPLSLMRPCVLVPSVVVSLWAARVDPGEIPGREAYRDQPR